MSVFERSSRTLVRDRGVTGRLTGMLALAATLAGGGFALVNPGSERPAQAALSQGARAQETVPTSAFSQIFSGGSEGFVSSPAAPLFLASLGTASRSQAEKCLAEAIYYEAGSEAKAGQRAVAQVVLNRLRHPAFPDSVCGVVYDGSARSTGCQFTFACDGSLRRRPSPVGWQRAMAVAKEALAGGVYGPVGYATHYHASWMVPYWAGSVQRIGQVGGHIFYTWKGAAGSAASFSQTYRGYETGELVADHRDERSSVKLVEARQAAEIVTNSASTIEDPSAQELLAYRNGKQRSTIALSDEQYLREKLSTALD
jgi:spore germination cell wall hydrolase CwlJ-like protein